MSSPRVRIVLALASASLVWRAAAAAQPCPAYFAPVTTGVMQDARINEASGMVASADHPGIYWVHNDSGDSARFFAMREDGSVLATYNVLGATATDWEDMARGPGPAPGVSYLYFADIGDNFSARSFVTVYRLPEPALPAVAGATVDLNGAVALEMEYPDAPHDAETLLADPASGDLFVVTKCFIGCGDGISKVYRYPFPHQDSMRVTLDEVASIPFGGGGLAAAATAGDISPNGDRIIVRSYTQALAWDRSAGQSIADALAAAPCTVPLASEPQGETLAFSGDGTSYTTLSEFASQPVWRIDERFADQTIAGRSLTVRDRSAGVDPTAPRVAATAKEVGTSNTIVGDPSIRGAVLEVLLNGGNPSAQTFVLLPTTDAQGEPLWQALSSGGFRYEDRDGAQGPISRVLLKRSTGGTFVLRIAGRGANGSMNLVPPNPGTDGFVTLRIPNGDRYCVRFGSDGQVRNVGATLFRVRGRPRKAAHLSAGHVSTRGGRQAPLARATRPSSSPSLEQCPRGSDNRRYLRALMGRPPVLK